VILCVAGQVAGGNFTKHWWCWSFYSLSS